MADDDEEATRSSLFEQAMQAFEAELGAGGGDDDRLPIGVPEEFRANVPTDRASMSANAADRWPERQSVPPRYFEDYEYTPANLPPVERSALQERLVAAGLIAPGQQYLNGEWDDVSVGAFSGLLALSNRNGFTWDQQLKVLENTTPANRPQFEAQAFLRPDPAATRQSIRSLMREMVGEDRDPSPDELTRLTSVFESFQQQAHDAATAAGRAAFDAQQEGEAAPAVVQDVDPVARFQEYMQDKYAPEVRSRQGVLDVAANRQGMLGSVFATQEAVLS